MSAAEVADRLAVVDGVRDELRDEIAELREDVAAGRAEVAAMAAEVAHLRQVADAIGAAVAEVAPMLQNPSGMLGALLRR